VSTSGVQQGQADKAQARRVTHKTVFFIGTPASIDVQSTPLLSGPHRIVDLINNTPLHVTKEGVVAQAHELAQGRSQEVALATRLQRTEWRLGGRRNKGREPVQTVHVEYNQFTA
jgi:hypothetical protein